jgi:hypothetical protein
MTAQAERRVVDGFTDPVDRAEEAGVPRLSTKALVPEDEMVPVFELDGRMFYIPRNPPASAMLAMLRTALQQGEEYGQIELLRRLLGEETYEALVSCPTLTFEEFNVILAIVGRHSVGMWQSYRAAAGNSFGGQSE